MEPGRSRWIRNNTIVSSCEASQREFKLNKIVSPKQCDNGIHGTTSGRETGFLEPELTRELYDGNSKNIQCYRLERPTAFYCDASSRWTQWEVSSVLVVLPYSVVSLIGLFWTYFIDPVLLKRSPIGKPQVAGSDSIIIGFESKKPTVVSPTRGCTK